MDILSSVSWFKKHQPKTIDDYVFETEEHKDLVKTWMENEIIPGNVLLYGKAGTGKSSLAHLLLYSIIKSQYDLNQVKDKSVDNIDSLHIWCQKKPVKSKKKVIYIEEVDRCSSAAFNSLKDELMEKYQEHVSFICTTNHLNRIEHAVQTRFTFIFNLNSSNLAGTYDRLANILNAEKIAFTPEGLKTYVENNIQIGLRDMINGLQVNVRNNSIDFTNLRIQKSEQEDEVIKNTLLIMKTIMESRNVKEKQIALSMPMTSIIAQPYSSILEIINYNNDLNYTSIYTELAEKVSYGPLIILIDRYLSTLESRRFLHIHFIAFLNEVLKCLTELNI